MRQVSEEAIENSKDEIVDGSHCLESNHIYPENTRIQKDSSGWEDQLQRSSSLLREGFCG